MTPASSGDRDSSSNTRELNRQIERLVRECEQLELRLRRIEESLIFRSLRRIGLALKTQQKKLGQALLHSSLHPFYLKVAKPKGAYEEYGAWARLQEAQLPGREWHSKEAAGWARRPRISILLPVHNPSRQWLQEAVDSVREQSYGNWQLCICDDASVEPWVAKWIESQASHDDRVRYLLSSEQLGIAGTLNRAATLADGEFVTFLDHDDTLHPLALHYVVEKLQDPDVQVVYTDEDHLDENGIRVHPQFKPEWSPDLLTSCMYWGHLLIASKRLMDQVGWFRSACDGSQDHDLALRLADHSIAVRHVPMVLYHWRQHPGSTAFNSKAKPYARVGAIKALTDALDRRGVRGEVQDGPLPHTFFIRGIVSEPPQVSVIVCSRSAALLEKCLQSLQMSTDYQNREVIAVLHTTEASGDLGAVVTRFGCVSVAYDGPFNFAKMNNLAAAKATGSILLFLNDDATPLRRDWMHHVVAHLRRPEVGVVGAKLIYPTGAIQHAGIALGMMDGVGHPGRGLFASDLYPWLDLTREVSAVTGACLGISRLLFSELGGFDVAFPINYNDVDLCLRAQQRGYRVIFEPRILLAHLESATRGGGSSFAERWLFHERWGEFLSRPDPYFPEAFDYQSEEIRLKLGG